METTAKLYSLAAANIFSNVHKRFTKSNSDEFDFKSFNINNIEYKWIDERRLSYKLFLQPIYDAIADTENSYNPCHIPHCSQALVIQQQFSEAMQQLFAHRQARDVIIKKTSRYHSYNTDYISRWIYS